MFLLYGAWIGDMAGNDWHQCMEDSKGTEAFADHGHLSATGLQTASVASAIIRSIEEQCKGKEDARLFRDFVCQEMEEFPGKKDREISAVAIGSPCGEAAVSLKEAVYTARVCAEATGAGNIPEAEAVAGTVFLAKMRKLKIEIRQFLEKYYFDPDEGDNVAAQAIACFLSSTDFWDAIRLALMSGGKYRCEAAAIAGAVAWCFYEFPFDPHNSRSIAARKILHQTEQYVPDELKAIDREFSLISIRRAGMHFRTGFCTPILNRNDLAEFLRKEREETASGIRKPLPDVELPIEDLYLIPVSDKPIQQVTNLLPVVRAVEYLEENEDRLFVKEDYLVRIRGLRMSPDEDLLRLMLQKKTNDQQGKYSIREVIQMLKDSQEFRDTSWVLWRTTVPGRIETKIKLCSPGPKWKPFPMHSIWEAKELQHNPWEWRIGSKCVLNDQSRGKTCIRIQLDSDRHWFLNVYFDSATGKLEKYSLDAEGTSDSHYEFMNERGVRQVLHQEGDEKKYLEGIMIRFIAENSGEKLISLIRPYFTAGVHYK